MAKARLSMEAYRDLAEVAHAHARGRISASKARGLCESIAFDGIRLADLDPANLGGSETDRCAWALWMGDEVPEQVGARLDMPQHRAAMVLSRLARTGRAMRVGHGRYRLRTVADRVTLRATRGGEGA